jgi:hypothetical protein
MIPSNVEVQANNDSLHLVEADQHYQQMKDLTLKQQLTTVKLCRVLCALIELSLSNLSRTLQLQNLKLQRRFNVCLSLDHLISVVDVIALFRSLGKDKHTMKLNSLSRQNIDSSRHVSLKSISEGQIPSHKNRQRLSTLSIWNMKIGMNDCN